jgi:recombination protein RecT
MTDPKERHQRAQELITQEKAAPITKGETIANYLDRQKPAILAALPKNVDVDRFTRIVLTTVRGNPKLLTCSPMSLLAAVMQSAQLGLEPGNGLGEAYIIPYAGEASFQMGYRGAVKLARNTGDISTIYAEAVYHGDTFKVQLGTEPRIDHVPSLVSEGRGEFENVEAVYAVAKLASGDTQFVVMTREEIVKHRDRYSKAANKKDSPWSDKLGAVEMAKKTAVIRLSKMLPLSAEAARAFALDGSVRHELSADMTLVPDSDSETVPPEALGIETERTAKCKSCSYEITVAEDCTPEDALEIVCEKCGEAGFE